MTATSQGALAYGALSLSIVLQSLALILIRLLVDRVVQGGGAISAGLLVDAVGNWLLWSGGLTFAVGMAFWIRALKLIPLSVAYPMGATSYVAIAVAGRFLFDEPLTPGRVGGIALIIAGVTLLHRGKVNS